MDYVFRIICAHYLSESVSVLRKSFSRTALIAAALLSSNCARAAVVLNDSTLDAVTAGNGHIDLELSASADGAGATTVTNGVITSAKANILRVAIDPSAPGFAQVSLIGSSAADLIFANGKATAQGDSNASCTATATGFGDAFYTTQAQVLSATLATCSCSGFAVGLIRQ